MSGGDIGNYSDKERKELFTRLFDDVVLPQRQRLLQYRDHTWQSAHVDSDGYLGELVAAIVTGEAGRSRRGKGGGAADLCNGTEVKSSYRLDPNIDFVIEGTLQTVGRSERVIVITHLPEELHLEEVRCQLNANSCSLQRLAANDPRTWPLSAELARTASKDALVVGRRQSYLRLSRGANFASLRDGTPVIVCLRQERAHLNFGNRSKAELNDCFRDPPVLVYYLFDPMGRPQIAVLRVGLTPGQRRAYLDRIFAGTSRKMQVQPYLFADNVRNEFYVSDKHSVAYAMNAELLALGAGTPHGFEVVHWSPTNPPLVRDKLDLFTAQAARGHCGPFSHTPIRLDLSTDAARRKATQDFYEHCVLPYYDGLEEFCTTAAVTRNIGFGNLSQHLVSLRTGLRGARSGARGADLLERDGTISEVKLATGEPVGANPMQNTDRPRLNLQKNKKAILEWTRLFPVRIVDLDDGLHVALHAPTRDLMTEFRSQVEDYFDAIPGSPNLQYHAMDNFPHDRYGVRGRYLEFTRVAWLKPTGDHEFRDVPKV